MPVLRLLQQQPPPPPPPLLSLSLLLLQWSLPSRQYAAARCRLSVKAPPAG
jgi:hypothetical protein